MPELARPGRRLADLITTARRLVGAAAVVIISGAAWPVPAAPTPGPLPEQGIARPGAAETQSLTRDIRELREELAQQQVLLQGLIEREQHPTLTPANLSQSGTTEDKTVGEPEPRTSGNADIAGHYQTASPEANLPVSITASQPVPPPPATMPQSTASVTPLAASNPSARVLSLPDDENSRRAYASGVTLASDLQQSLQVQKSLGISLPADLIMQGLQDAFNHKPLRMTEDTVRTQMSGLNADFTSRLQARRTEELARGKLFSQDFRKRKGVRSEAGILYQVSDKGSAVLLKKEDFVTLRITGSLPDGTVFDGSGPAGQSRKIRVGSMLPAVATVLKKVGVGGRVTVVVPPENGYGDMGLPPQIPGGATLIFDIEVLGRGESNSPS